MNNDHDGVLDAYRPHVGEINDREGRMRAKNDEELRTVTGELGARLRKNTINKPEAPEKRQPIPFRTSRKKAMPDDKR